MHWKVFIWIYKICKNFHSATEQHFLLTHTQRQPGNATKWHGNTLWYVNNVLCYVVLLRMSWRRDVMWLHRCILAPRSTSLILSGSQRCRLKVLLYRSWNCWMISTTHSTTPYHVTTSTRSVTCSVITWYSQVLLVCFSCQSSFQFFTYF